MSEGTCSINYLRGGGPISGPRGVRRDMYITVLRTHLAVCTGIYIYIYIYILVLIMVYSFDLTADCLSPDSALPSHPWGRRPEQAAM